MAITLDGSAGVSYPAGTTGTMAGVGDGQTWQNVASSRAFGTTYTNTTGKPIMVNVVAYNNTNSSWAILTPSVGGVALADARAIVNQSAAYISFIVPAGSTYVINNTGTAAALNIWAELR